MIVDVIIPAYNEEDSIPLVLRAIPKDLVREVIVVDNNSTDATFEVSRSHGAIALKEKQQGYGAACLKGMQYIAEKREHPDVVVFLDADYSDHPEEMEKLLAPIREGKVDFVLGSRVKKFREKGAMYPQQVFGNWLATRLMRITHRVRYYDLGPFRAIRYSSLMALGMKDTNYGWTVEMQIKAAKKNIPFAEVPVHYRKRIGVSKVSGTIKGTIMAGYKIIATIIRYW